MKQPTVFGSVLCVVILVALIISFSTKNKSNTDTSEIGSIDQIREKTELLMVGNFASKEFFGKNPDYNPSWFAKLLMDRKDVPNLEKELKSKKLLNMTRSSSPSQYVSWWTPSRDAATYTFMTSHNAPVTVIISPAETNVELYIWWSSP